jgi:hypothetical protein
MIPVAGAMRLGKSLDESKVHGFRLVIPFLLLWVLLLPLLLLIVPVLFVACLCVRVNPFRAIGVLFRILAALKGTNVEVANDRFSILLNIF